MKFIVIGSGGCVCTPKPLCQCQVCVQARTKGYPYARCGCSLYLEDISLLVDTPEDIAVALNNADIKSVDSIIYSHWDPDHTLGMRIMEQLRLEWLDYYDNIKPDNPITVYANTETMNDLNGIRSKYGSLLAYYEHMSTESFDAFIKRNCDLCDLIMDEWKERNVLIVTHAANTRIINYYFTGNPLGKHPIIPIFCCSCRP